MAKYNRVCENDKVMEDENSEKVVKFCGRETKRQMQRDSYWGIRSISEKQHVTRKIRGDSGERRRGMKWQGLNGGG